ncbi:thioredoxin-like protein AAED1 [Mizuhopecten yessoensis]|uniref:Thioredoxin-like protein AAED1 n=1 Tax=Mizuhopecten yessoensis TaxID=6573 RepID=A0A210PQ26_MIZYE|nr:thioredoxin-like protein AAED1 [Mizuhopecten yessoensis]OWF38577.1 Thioredoxin-like protein AAED1 [Mizuhopecten yessoensis]
MADEKKSIDSPVDKVDDLKMSRGEKPEIVVDLEKLHDLFVYDEMENKIRFSDIYKHQKTVVVFIRHFLCFVCKDYMEDLAIIPLEYLQAANVRIVVIGPAPCKFIKPFKKETGFNYTLYTDPEREIYKALNLKEKMEHGDDKNNKHVKQNVIMGVLRSTWKAMRVQEYEGNIKQQGGAFVLGPGDAVHFAHIDENSLDHTPINDLLEKAGVAAVSFPKDKRVQHI